MKIAIIGTQCTGKTTLIKKIKESSILDESYVFIDEIVRTLVKKNNIKINEEGDYESQLLILQTHYDNALNNENMITDRSCVDAWSYALHNHMKGFFTEKDMGVFNELFLQTLKMYDKIFYIPVEFDIVSDDFRSLNKSFQKDIENIMEYILEDASVNFITLKGDIETRLQTFKDNISEKKNNISTKDSLKVL